MQNYAVAKIVGGTPTQNFKSRNGQSMSRCTLVVRTVELYPQTLALTAFDDLVLWAGRKDVVVEVAYAPQSHEHEGRWFTELKAISVKAINID